MSTIQPTPGLSCAVRDDVLYVAFDARLLPKERGPLHILSPVAALHRFVTLNEGGTISTKCSLSRSKDIAGPSVGESVKQALMDYAVALDGTVHRQPGGAQIEHTLDLVCQATSIAGAAYGAWCEATKRVADHFQVRDIRVIGSGVTPAWAVDELTTPHFKAAYQAKA